MPKQSVFFRKRFDQLDQGLDLLLYTLSTYALPILIGLVSLLAFFSWKTQYPITDPQPLEIQVVKESDSMVGPAMALAQLQGRALNPHYDTQRSEAPFWFSFIAPKEVEHTPLMIEFPSRHAIDIACWDARTLNPLGSGSNLGTAGGISAVKAGFALELSPALKGEQVLCRTSSIGPARISALKWQAADLKISAQEFHRKSGLLDGGILILALFVLITALINRSALYILFAAWLVVNLRMGALSAGWDEQWLGNSVPQDWLLRMRLVTTAVYYVLTVTLFKVLFHDDLSKVGSLLLLRIAQWTCLPLLLLSGVMTYQSYLPYLWVSSGLTVVVLVYFLSRILLQTHSRVAMWFSASISISLIASFSEVIAAALGIKGLIGSVNFVTAALSSCLLAALAIAEHMRQEHVQRLEVQAELKHTYEAMPIGLFTLDLHGRFMSANPALLGMLSPNVLTDEGNAWPQYFADGAWTQLHQMVHNKTENEMEIQGRAVPGFSDSKRFLVKATLARDKIEGSLQDVTEKSRVTEKLYFLANHDSLTKVLNRRGIEKALNGAIKKLASGNSLALAYLDLDRFKLINDLFGHGAGDDVLQQVCRRVSDMLSRELRFGRVGGDEFVIMFPETPIALASLMCRGIVDSIGTLPYHVGDKAFYVRGSIGLVEVSVGMQFNDAMSTADRACRQAKSANNGGLVVYEKHAVAFQQHEAELKLIALLATSSATDGLYLEMQPIMSLTKPHESLNFEVLLRMRDPDGKVVPTDRLIAAGENSGRMGMIDRWVLSTTLAWINTHHTQMTRTKFVCMNLSGASLNDEKFLQDVYAMLEQNLHIVGQLCLEITESVALHDVGNTRRFVDKVRGYGAKVALDDFGAGYTSFSYLKEFTADLLKIDGSFIVNMNKHPANIAIVEAIVNLAKNLGMKVIAEWAEDNATVQTLTELGVDYVQGFVVARPQHPDKILSAESSASFIQDVELAQHVYLIGRPDHMQAQVDLFSEVRAINLH
ncbi:putative bifunctional diguanylate cyclase/phosphodiesterase [Rhodoferax sp. UBA5149]|uniref:putative bifunctional diguanylate cyclase/phosphodiesterase n=1 Tax=Rhodoferax sp. UBA5149 TaxID=1947379 RepID=UPI0025D6C696|nr:EAL domain-containing protein [Rhodoferax sp. UBA5149]